MGSVSCRDPYKWVQTKLHRLPKLECFSLEGSDDGKDGGDDDDDD